MEQIDSTITFDAVIVGAGMVGSTLALVLGQCGYRVLLVEQYPPRAVPLDADMRTMALSHASQVLLAQLGLWPSLALRAARMDALCVTVQGQWGSTHLIPPTSAGQTNYALGYVISVFDIDVTLQKAISANTNITLMRPATVVSHQPQANTWQVGIQCADTLHQITTRLFIAADGAGSPLAKAQQIQYQTTEYSHQAICANVALETKSPHTAYERFLKEGALALLPWIKPYATCIWTIQGSPDDYLGLSDADYLAACQSAFGRRVGRFLSIGKRIAYPLTMCVAKHQISWRFLVMGNAAHQLHPIAAQGLNLSLADIAYVRSLLLNGGDRFDLGASGFLEQYQQHRWPQQAKVIFPTDMMAKTLSSQAIPSVLRGIGNTLLDMLPPLKRPITQWGMGA